MEKVSGQTPNIETIKKKVNAEKNKQSSEDKAISAKNSEDVKVTLSEKSKELKKELTSAEKAIKIHQKKFGNVDKPGVFFLSGFDWFGASSVKGNYDGIKDMAEAVDGAEHFSWDQKDELIAAIKERKPSQPIVLIGHSFGGDTAVEIANEFNTLENGFRTIDLLVTLDSVGFDNDLIPQNVRQNLNFVASGPYKFINDGPNIAANFRRTEVDNYLRLEKHADLDDSIDIQIEILDAINKIV